MTHLHVNSRVQEVVENKKNPAIKLEKSNVNILFIKNEFSDKEESKIKNKLEKQNDAIINFNLLKFY